MCGFVHYNILINSELIHGIELADAQGRTLQDDAGKNVTSKVAAKTAIGLVVVSRIIMAIPGMSKLFRVCILLPRQVSQYPIFQPAAVPPILTNMLEKRGLLKRMPWIALPFQTLLCGVLLVFATPLACAIFPQIRCVLMW